MNMAQNWEAPFTGMSMGSVAGAFSGFAQVGTETTSVTRWNSLMVWEGNTADVHAACNFHCFEQSIH